MIENIFEGVQDLLINYQNDDCGWGEHRTQSSRITNTCEVLWALSNLETSNFDYVCSYDFIKKSVDGKNPEKRQNCLYKRDYAWVLIALTSCHKYLVEEKDLDKYLISALEFILFDKQDTSKESEVFSSSIQLIGLLKYYDYLKINNKPIDGNIIEKINSIKTTLLEFKNSDNGWGNSNNEKSTAGYTAYVLYGLSLYGIHLSPMDDILEEGINYLRKSNLEIVSYESDKIGKKRPYRHYTIAWSILAISNMNQFNFDLGIKLVKRLITEKKNNGWSIFNIEGDDIPLTWSTALASIAINDFFKSIDFLRLLNQIPIQDKISRIQQIKIRLRTFREEKPLRFNLFLLIIPLVFIVTFGIISYYLFSYDLKEVFTLNITLIGLYITALGTIYTMFNLK